ncbi:MAG: hypothetical protein B7Z61_08025 [Acidobacteria bacterium 37-71-11]|nr:MAG: hypothetical protein B7Z61_08025 [Acidobacteria bacterium 37-71-11]
MGKILAVSLIIFSAVFTSFGRAQGYAQYEAFSPDQLDNLLAPIALYPDPLLAQVLLAATFPDQIDDAARFVRADFNPGDVDGQWWDVSVRAVAHYPTVVAMMADKLDWTMALGQAYANQSTDVMASIQRLRAQARQAGNLYTTSEIQVVDTGGEISLWPAQPQYIYVPQYDPAVVFFARAPLFFGARFVIGAWLNFDFDWGQHRVFYHGWDSDRGWAGRSRQYIHPNAYYVNNTYRNVPINRAVIRQPLNYGALNRYDDIHRTTNFNNFRSNNRVVTQPPVQPYRAPVQPYRAPVQPYRAPVQPYRAPVQPYRASVQPYRAPVQPYRAPVPNKIITRNIDITNPRINDFRGHVPQAPVQVHAPVAPAFNPVRGGFDPRVTSQRGQTSRALVRTAPAPVVRRNVVKQPQRPPVMQKKDKKNGKKN